MIRTAIIGAAVLVALGFGSVGDKPGTALALGPTFGDGSDGPITFSSNTQFNPPVDAVVDSGTSGSTSLTVSSLSGVFIPGQKILIHQTRGSSAGAWELNSVLSYALGNLTTTTGLAHTYASSGADRAQVLVVPQYTNVTVNAGVTVSAKPWNGSTGGIFAVLANGTITVAGTVDADGKGYRQNTYLSLPDQAGNQGEGTSSMGGQSTSANGTGGGGGQGGFGAFHGWWRWWRSPLLEQMDKPLALEREEQEEVQVALPT